MLTHAQSQFKEIQSRYQTDEDGNYQLVGLPGKAVVGLQEVNGKYPAGIGWETFSDDDKLENGRLANTFHRPVVPGPKWPTAMTKVDIEENALEYRVDFEIGMGLSIPIKIVGPDGKPLTGVVADQLAGTRETWQTIGRLCEPHGYRTNRA